MDTWMTMIRGLRELRPKRGRKSKSNIYIIYKGEGVWSQVKRRLGLQGRLGSLSTKGEREREALETRSNSPIKKSLTQNQILSNNPLPDNLFSPSHANNSLPNFFFTNLPIFAPPSPCTTIIFSLLPKKKKLLYFHFCYEYKQTLNLIITKKKKTLNFFLIKLYLLFDYINMSKQSIFPKRERDSFFDKLFFFKVL